MKPEMDDSNLESDKWWVGKWNTLHCKFVPKGADYRNKKMARYCEKLIVKAKKDYYNGKPIMSDGYFDRLEGYLRVLNPASEILKKVGS